MQPRSVPSLPSQFLQPPGGTGLGWLWSQSCCAARPACMRTPPSAACGNHQPAVALHRLCISSAWKCLKLLQNGLQQAWVLGALLMGPEPQISFTPHLPPVGWDMAAAAWPDSHCLVSARRADNEQRGDGFRPGGLCPGLVERGSDWVLAFLGAAAPHSSSSLDLNTPR